MRKLSTIYLSLILHVYHFGRYATFPPPPPSLSPFPVAIYICVHFCSGSHTDTFLSIHGGTGLDDAVH